MQSTVYKTDWKWEKCRQEVLDIEARLQQGTWKQKTGLDAFGGRINRALMCRWEEKEESRLPAGLYPRATGWIRKGMSGGWGEVSWEGGSQELLFVHKPEMSL